MLTQFRHYTDDELSRFVANQPGHLAAEGELVRRVVAEEWAQNVRDEELEKDLANEQDRVGALEAQIEELNEKLETIREAAAAA